MRELVGIIDPVTGDLTIEGLSMEEAEAAAADFLAKPRELNCAQPLATTALPTSGDPQSPVLRVAALWHGSVVEGPGRRSVLQVQGCPLRCSRLIYSTTGSSRRPALSLNRVNGTLFDALFCHT